MLPRESRLTDSVGFTFATRQGTRGGARGLVVHVAVGREPGVPRVGLIVSRAVGGSVVRSTVKRRLRHLLRNRLDRFSPGSVVAVRALPASATMTSSELATALDRCLSRAGVAADPSTTPLVPTTETAVR